MNIISWITRGLLPCWMAFSIASAAADQSTTKVNERIYLPVNVGQANLPQLVPPGVSIDVFLESLKSTTTDLNEAGALPRSQKQELLRRLPYTDTFIYVLDGAMAVKAGLVVLTAEVAKKVSVVVQDFAQYEVVVDSATKINQRIGIGLRLLIIVNESTHKVATMGIPQIAVAVDNRKLEATVRLNVIGIAGKKVTEAMPFPAELNFTTLMQMYNAVDVIKRSIWDDDETGDGTTITPQTIAFGSR